MLAQQVEKRFIGTRVADAWIRILQAHGVDTVFGIPGGTISPLYDALLDSDIDVVTNQHETMAVYMASGYARATGKPGVVLVTSGPGVLNTVTGIAAAYHDEVPLVVLGGEVVRSNAYRGALQDGGSGGLDVMQAMRPITKLTDTLQQPQRFAALLEQALAESVQHPRGPCFLRVPTDVAQSHVPTVQISQAPMTRAAADEATCATVATLLHTAERPVLFLGLGARVTGASREVLDLAEWSRCPVITDIEARGVIPEDHPLWLGSFGVGGCGPAAKYLAEADLILTVGARLDDTTTAGFSEVLRPEQGTLVQLDYDMRRLCRAYVPDLAVLGELRGTLARIRAETPVARADTVLKRDALLRDVKDEHEDPPVPDLSLAPHHPASVIDVLQATFGPDAIYTSDIGNHLLFAASGLRIQRPDGFHVALGVGGMGSGIGTAMGLAMAHDQRRVVGICGDGGLLMVGNELATCVKHRIGVVIAVLDDGQLGMVRHGIQRVYGRTDPFQTGEVDFETWARGLGVNAIRVTSRFDIPEDIPTDRPTLLIFPTDPEARMTNPREALIEAAQ